MRVDFHKVRFGQTESAAVMQAMADNWFSPRGPMLEKFGKGWADRVGMKYGWPVSSGTAAIHLALLAMGIKAGQQVIVPTYTCSPTVYPVSYVGAAPVFIDCEMTTYGIDPDKLDIALRRQNGNIKAVIVAHLYGSACNDAVVEICERNKVPLIEDACEGDGATWHQLYGLIGSKGLINCFSFRGDKVLTALGTGGVFVTNDEELFRKMKLYSDLGLKNDTTLGRYRDLEVVGFNYEISNPAAAFGLAQIGRLNEIINTRRKVASWWHAAVQEHPWMHPMADYTGHVWYQYPIRFDLKMDGKASHLDAFGQRLLDRKVPFIPPFWPMHWQPAYSSWKNQTFLNAERAAQQVLCLPCYPDLQMEEITWMVDQMAQAYREIT